MADYDSDSSAGGEDIETNVLLGYASKEPTGDDFSQLGGRPTWLENKSEPSGILAKCKVCNGVLSLLLQLNGDLPDRFPGHERRLYVLGCRRKPCRRKDGSIRALRAVRHTKVAGQPASANAKTNGTASQQPAFNIGETLFGAKAPATASANPFPAPSTTPQTSNPFSSIEPKGQQQSTTATSSEGDSLAETFAQKARIAITPEALAHEVSTAPPEQWPTDPAPYPLYHLDADKEYLGSTTASEPVPSNARLDTEGGSSSAAEEKAAFESAMDKTFQRFADRLAQNPEQVLRYEFAGQPLLYSKSDAVGKRLSPAQETKVQTASSRDGTAASGALRIPRCTSCGAARVFEMQLTPHAITELEAEDMSIDGMDWGTVIVGVCSEDCQEKGKAAGQVGYVEEWVGVQWEEIADSKKR